MPPHQAQLLDLDDAALVCIIRKLGLARRTVMAVCKRLKDLAQDMVHSYQQPGQTVMDAIELAQPGDTVHLRDGYYKEALLLKKPLHLTCDGGGQARICSPARYAMMVAGRGCLLENLVLKAHQVDSSTFFLVEQGRDCKYIEARRCELLGGSYVGIQDLKGPDTRMVLRHCLLHVGAMVMAGALEMTDCTVKCCSDPVVGLPGTTLVMRRCQFVDVGNPVCIGSRSAVMERCTIGPYGYEPVAVSNIHPQMDADPEDVEDINARLLYLEDAPADLPVWIPLPQWVKASGTRASEAQRAAALAGEVLEGRIVMWGNRAFESASNRGVTAQQQDVRQEVRQMMLELQRAAEAEDLGPGAHLDDISIGNSLEQEAAGDWHGEWEDDAAWGDELDAWEDEEEEEEEGVEGEWSDDPGSPWPEGGAGDDLMFGGAFPDQYSPAHPAYYELNTSSGDDDAPPGEPGQEGEEEEWQDAGEGWQEEWRDDDEEGEGGEAGGHSRDNTPLPESHEPPSSPSSGSYGGSDPEGSQQPGPAAGGGGAAASSRRGSGRGKGRGKGGGGGGGQA